MKKIMNKIVAGLIALTTTCSTLIAGTSFASSYTSTLNMAYNSWHAGDERYYDSSNYYIGIYPSSLYNGSTSVDVSVCSVTKVLGIVWDYNVLCSTTLNLPTTGIIFSTQVGTASSGNRCYTFSTSGNRGGFYSSYVAMSST